MNRYVAAFLAMLCASVAVSSACLAAPADRPARSVTYRDLDLSSPAGIAALHRRIERAINQVCADPTGPSPAVTIDLGCKVEALAAARMQAEILITGQQAEDRLAEIEPISSRP